MRLTKRYVCAGIFFTSLFWITVDFTAVLWSKGDSSTTSLRVGKDLDRQNGDNDILVNIDYFKRYYKYMLNPQPGSAGMDGSSVLNSQNEKVDEDKRMFDYGFNELSSSKISLERSIPDNRDAA